MKLRKLLLALALMVAAFSTLGDAGRITLGHFSQSSLAGWRSKVFDGNTQYTLASLEGRVVLKAHSQAAASGLFYEQAIDLDKTPYLNWSWRVDTLQNELDERSKVGDDYPARVYVIFSSGPFFWQQGALTYVWSNNQAAGSEWKSAYTRHSQMIALQGGRERLGQWTSEKRDLREDLQRYFGNGKREIRAIALMTDTDNSAGEYLSYYGDIYLSAE